MKRIVPIRGASEISTQTQGRRGARRCSGSVSASPRLCDSALEFLFIVPYGPFVPCVPLRQTPRPSPTSPDVAAPPWNRRCWNQEQANTGSSGRCGLRAPTSSAISCALPPFAVAPPPHCPPPARPLRLRSRASRHLLPFGLYRAIIERSHLDLLLLSQGGTHLVFGGRPRPRFRARKCVPPG